MTIQLINGHFTPRESLDLITRMIHVKISYHEEKIREATTEEDVKMREKRIRELQRDLFEIRQQLQSREGFVDLASKIELN
ncbi:MAG: hypothetical protein ACK5XV_11865 [Flavobacteriales bacterium]